MRSLLLLAAVGGLHAQSLGGGLPSGHQDGHAHGNDCHGHGHSHGHSHGGYGGVDAISRKLPGLSAFCIENPQTAAMLATILISLSSLVVMPLMPFIDTDERSRLGTRSPRALRSAKLLTLLVSFAAGGLLGDVFLHLVPETMAQLCAQGGEDMAHDSAHHLGLPLLGGLIAFFVMERGIKALTHADHGHGHGHGHEHGSSSGSGEEEAESEPQVSRQRGRSPGGRGGAARRKASPGGKKSRGSSPAVSPGPAAADIAKARRSMGVRVRPGALLNFVADAMHNFTDGLAMGVTFAQGSGIPTTIAVFVHEVPHNLADFAILIDSGMTKTEALAAQFVSALGAVAGCIAGLHMPNRPWMHAFVGGGFIYVATVGAVAGLVGKKASPRDAVEEMVAMLVGVGLMYFMLH